MAFKLKGTQFFGKSPFKGPKFRLRNSSGTTGPRDWFNKMAGRGRWKK